MRKALVRYQSSVILGLHILSIVSSFLFLRVEATPEIVVEVLVVVLVAHILSRFIQQTVSPLIRYYRSLGQYAVIHRLGAVSTLLFLDIVLVAVAVIWVLGVVRGQQIPILTLVSYLLITIIPSLTMLIQVFLVHDAKEELRTVALVRRFATALGLGFALVLLTYELDITWIAPLLASMQLVILIQVIRIRFRYTKELTYRRQYEDSGHQETRFHLVKTLSLQALTLVPNVLVQGVAIGLVFIVPPLLVIVEQPVPSTMYTSLVLIVSTASAIRLLFHTITPRPFVLQEAEASNNKSRLRSEVTMWLERGILLEVILAVFFTALLGVMLPLIVEIDYPITILSIIIGYLFGISAYLSHVFSRLSMIASSIIALTAIFIVVGGSFYYSVYFGFTGILGVAVVTLGYIYTIGYVWAFKEYDIEAKPHFIQLLKVAGLFLLSSSLLLVLWFVLPPVVAPLSLSLRVLVISSIIVLVEVVVMYAYIRVTGLSPYLFDSQQLKQQFDTIYMSIQEEEAIW